MMQRRRVAVALAVVGALTVAACSSGGSGKQFKGPTTSTKLATVGGPPQTKPPPAQSASWPTYHHDAARTGVADDQAAPGQIRKAWESPALDGDVYAQPLVVGDHVLVATEANSVYALDAASGRQA